MSQRTPTAWDSNTAKNNGVAYSDSGTAYSSATTSYSSATATLDDFGKLPEAWSKVAKTGTAWNPNPLAITNLYAYDSATKTYDSTTDTYDGIVVGQDFQDQEQPTAWSKL